jgi:glyoxylase-like metal-dependent hydrolase (beta-lactamase superfamily II)
MGMARVLQGSPAREDGRSLNNTGDPSPAGAVIVGPVEFEHLAGRVWVYRHDPDPDAIRPCTLVIADDRGSVVVDAGNGPEHAREIQQAMATTNLPTPRWLVYTHHHWDHTWGACAWDDVEVIAHAAGRKVLEAEAERPWSHRYLRDQVAQNPRLGPSFRARALAIPDWDGFRLVPPQTTFADSLTLPVGVELRHVGGNHAEDSLIVIDPESSVVALGDCFYPPPFHLREDGDTTDHRMLRHLLAERHEWYVDAHSAPRRHPSR